MWEGEEGGGRLTGRERDCEVEQEGTEDVIFLESEAIERVDEDQLEVQRNAQNEPVGDACRAVGKLSRRRPAGREEGREGGGRMKYYYFRYQARIGSTRHQQLTDCLFSAKPFELQ